MRFQVENRVIGYVYHHTVDIRSYYGIQRSKMPSLRQDEP